MGIQGLLPFLKKSSREVNIKNFSGSTVAVDTYCWLHKGAFSCAEKLAKGEKTDGYVYYCMKMANMLISAGVKPILVFDGKNLPLKSITEEKRRENRNKYKIKGKEFLREGKLKEAKECFQRCVDVTPEMAYEVILACRQRGIDYIVAPYEADAQLAYLNKCGIAQIIITEDSDLILFGCDKVMFKMDSGGSGILIERSSLYKCMGVHAENFTFDKFRFMCILSGCDYLPSLPGIGLAKSCKFFSKTTNPNLDMVLSKIPTYLKMPNLTVTSEYKNSFIKANNTFLYQLVFSPIERKLIPVNPYPADINIDDLEYAGKYFSDQLAFQLAIGNININTMKAIDDFDPRKQLRITKTVTWDGKTSKMKSIWHSDYQIPDIKCSEEILNSPISTKGKKVTVDVKRILKPVNVEKKISPSDKELFNMYGESTPETNCNTSTSSKRLKTDSVSKENETTVNITPHIKPKSINIFKVDTSTPRKIVRSRFFFDSNKIDSKERKSVPWLDEIQKEYNQITSTPKMKLDNETSTDDDKTVKDVELNNCKFKWMECQKVTENLNLDEIIPCSPSVQVPFKTVKVNSDNITDTSINSSQSDILSSPSVLSQPLSNCSIDTFSCTQNSDIYESPSQSQMTETNQTFISSPSSPENRIIQENERVSQKNEEIQVKSNSLKLTNFKTEKKIFQRCRRTGLSKKKNISSNEMRQLNLRESFEKFKFQKSKIIAQNPVHIDLTMNPDKNCQNKDSIAF